LRAFGAAAVLPAEVNDNHGFYSADGRFRTVDFPTGNNASPVVDQLLGVNDHDTAVGFYTNGQGSNRGYTYDIRTRTFTRVLVPGAPAGQSGPSLTAAGINNRGDVTGFYAAASGQTDAFLRLGPATASAPWTTRMASAPPPSTASTTRATWSGSTRTRRATPTP
jgi:hypothetical protein